jgi:hypothetical protein
VEGERTPKPLMPSLAALDGLDANLWCADQLAPLKQGPRNNTSLRPRGQSAGIGHMKRCLLLGILEVVNRQN